MAKVKDDRTSRPDADNPEVMVADFKRARPASEVLPEIIGEKATQELMRRGVGRPAKADKKVNQTLRLDADVVEAFRQEGRGWQARINDLLRQHSSRHLATRLAGFTSTNGEVECRRAGRRRSGAAVDAVGGVT